MKNNFYHPLMHNNFDKSDIDSLLNFLNKKDPILTQSEKVREFENKWSKWLGVKYSTFVNSGSSANLITLSILKLIKPKGEVIVPSLTWVSDINSVILNNFKPVFVDINPRNLCMDESKILESVTNKTIAVFITHAQGFNGLTENLLKFLKKRKIFLIEDVCESHGATFKNKKLGSFGLISNFSFYYAHHMSTIEGGMICTNDKKIYHLTKLLRSHGMARELNDPKKEKYFIKKYPKLSPKFIFLNIAYNMRNTEIGAVLGISQLRKLNSNIKKRNKNLCFFLKLLDDTIFQTNFDLEGISNYALPLILKNKNYKLRAKLEKIFNKYNIEFRRGNAGGGNQLRQPYLKNYVKKINLKKYPIVDHIHFFGYYIGNYPSLTQNKIKDLCKILNSIGM